MEKCIEADCTIHESWYVLELKKQIANTSSNSDYPMALRVIKEYKQVTPEKVRSCIGIECFIKQHLIKE
jgi:hypothetical protein